VAQHPMTRLSERLGLGSRDVVSLVGAGGKTTALLRVGSELVGLGHRVVMTTTTKMGVDQLPDWATVQRAGEPLLTSEPVFVIGDISGEKVTGVAPEYVDELFTSGVVDHVVVEADGARRRWLKAPASHEPVIPSSTTIVVAIASLDAIGRPIREVAHRSELVCQLTGQTPDDVVTASDIATVLGHSSGGLQGAPDGARVVAMLTRAVPGTDEAVTEIVERLHAVDRIERIIVQGVEG
jgi:molybdenum cofactor cytidylyltransferase